jgi:pyroglutamyl-peptidase
LDGALKKKKTTVLVTGFTPFGGESINPSWQIASMLPCTIADSAIEVLEVPTEFSRAITVTTKAIDQLSPSIVLSLGQAGGRAALSLERVAINIDDAAIADNAGKQPIDTPIVARAPAAYFATLPIKAMVAAMTQHNIPASISNSAGTFVCNHLLYGVLHHIAKNKFNCRAGFMHVPYLPSQVVARTNMPSMSLADMCQGVEIAIMTAIQQKTDIRLVGGSLD